MRMPRQSARYHAVLVFCALMLPFILSACNLGAAPEAPTTTPDAESTPRIAPTRTPQDVTSPISASPTSIFGISTPITGFTAVAIVPTLAPTNTPRPTSVAINSPFPGSVISGSVQIVGSASHPQFLQYRLEYATDPNTSNQWIPITGVIQTPILNGPLGVWSTSTLADGRYQLRLRVFLRDGSQLVTQVGNIQIRNQQPTVQPTNTTIPRPIAAFSQDVTVGTAPFVVRFTNQSAGQISALNWDFGDGGTSSNANPIYTYRDPGTYTVTLQVRGPGGTSNVSQQINVTSPAAPNAEFIASTLSGEAPLTVNFTDQSSGNISSYSWNFGDGTTSAQPNPTHIFTDEGTYNVILTVQGVGGADTVVRQITVEDPTVPPPQAAFNPTRLNGEVPFTVTFSNATVGQANAYLWDFNGDGITDSTDPSPTFTYEDPGTYQVRLIAIGEGGQTTASQQIQVVAPPDAPSVSFEPSPQSGVAPLQVQFNNQTGGNVTEYAWDFQNDGITDNTAVSPTFTFEEPGTYNVRLTATGPGGSTSTTRVVSVATPLELPQAAFIPEPSVGQAPLTVVFTNQSEGTQLTFAWDFQNDGVTDSTQINPTFTYNEAGNYTARLQITDPQGQTSTATRTINVSQEVVIAPPSPAFTFTPETGRAPLTVAFTNQTTGEFTQLRWDFNNDGAVDSNAENPSFTFATEGIYRVTLTAQGPGGTASISSDVVVSPALLPPTANFNISTSSGVAPLMVNFTNASSGQIDTYEWDLDGDGAIDITGPGPHSFTYPVGNFTAVLRVSNAAGSNTASQTISVVAPTATATATPSQTNTPLPTATNEPTITPTDTAIPTDTPPPTATNTAIPTDTPPPTATDTAVPTDTPPPTATNTAIPTNTPPPTATDTAIPTNTPPPTATDTAVPTDTPPPTATDTAIPTDTPPPTATDTAIPTNTPPPTATDTAIPTDTPPPTATDTAVPTDTPPPTATDTAVPTDTPPPTATPVPAPVASFVANPTSGVAPLTVTFTNQSTGQIDTYEWDFDGDLVPDASGPGPHTFAYTQPGSYTVTLRVRNIGGENSAATQINVNAPATATNPPPPTATNTAIPTATDEPTPIPQPTTPPDDAALIATGDLVVSSDLTGNLEIFVLNRDGSNPINVTENPAIDGQPAWSPDGNQIAFVSNRTGSFELFILDLRTAEVRQVTMNDSMNTQPRWSPDGQQLVFVSNRFGDEDIFVINVDGSAEQQLTSQTASDRDPTWSPDGNTILFASNVTGVYDLYRLDLTNDPIAPVPFLSSPSNDIQPDIDQDGRIAFSSDRAGSADIYLVDVNGDPANPLRITTNPGSETEPRWIPNEIALVYTGQPEGRSTSDIFRTEGGEGNPVLQIDANVNSPIIKE